MLNETSLDGQSPSKRRFSDIPRNNLVSLSCSHNNNNNNARRIDWEEDKSLTNGTSFPHASSASHIDPTLSTPNASRYELQHQKHQKEAKRVKFIDQELFEREYFDNSEQHRTPYDMTHINAVREHYALRRDLLQTPKWKSRVENNTRNVQVWVENRNVMSSPVRETDVDANFTAFVRRRAEQRMRRERMMRSP